MATRTSMPRRTWMALGALGLASTIWSPMLFAQTPSTALKLYFSPARNDNFTTGTLQGQQDALAAGYMFIRIEGYQFPSSQPGTVPLKLYWSAARGDNFSTATAQGEQDALAAGYQFVRVEGYVYPTQQPGTVPLKLYWSAARRDNFTTATAQGEQDALGAGYQFIRVEGYVSPSPSSIDIDLDSFLGAGHYMTSHGVLLDNGHVDAQTRTRTITMFGGYHGCVQVLLADANGYTIGSSAIQSYGVDGTVIGRSDRTDYWTDQIDPGTAQRAATLHVQHFWCPRYDFFKNLADQAVAVKQLVSDFVQVVKGNGGDAK